MVDEIASYDGLDDDSLQQLSRDLKSAFLAATTKVSEGEPGYEVPQREARPAEIPPFHKLIGVDPAVYRQINAALAADKRHFMLYGPPGTGKTSLAQYLAGALSERWTLVTGSADWSSQDIIGGYQPLGAGRVAFVPGVLLNHFDRPLVIDELNRCDIDKVLGPLFTVLSGQRTTLPYRTDIGDPRSTQYAILPRPFPQADSHEFAPGPDWRLITTINSIDKAALYQMSYALMRRFAWIFIDVPQDLDAFLDAFLRSEGALDSESPPVTVFPLAGLWRAVNRARTIGPAPIIDLIRCARIVSPSLDFSTAPPTPEGADACLDGFYMYLLPMLDGVLGQEAEELAEGVCEALALTEGDDRRKQLRSRLLSVAV